MLLEAKQLFKEEGAGYIVDNFDTYISVVLNASQVSTDIQMEAFEDLHRGNIAL